MFPPADDVNAAYPVALENRVVEWNVACDLNAATPNWADDSNVVTAWKVRDVVAGVTNDRVATSCCAMGLDAFVRRVFWRLMLPDAAVMMAPPKSMSWRIGFPAPSPIWMPSWVMTTCPVADARVIDDVIVMFDAK